MCSPDWIKGIDEWQLHSLATFVAKTEPEVGLPHTKERHTTRLEWVCLGGGGQAGRWLSVGYMTTIMVFPTLTALIPHLSTTLHGNILRSPCLF